MNTRNKIIAGLNECLAEINLIQTCGIDNAARIVRINNKIVSISQTVDDFQRENDTLRRELSAAGMAEKEKVE